MEIFKHNLFNKVDMVTKDKKRWDRVHSELPERYAVIPNITKFDAGYFGVHAKEANIMDAMNRMALERAVEAIYDAGMHPSELEGTRTAVFTSINNSDSQQTAFYKTEFAKQNFIITG